MHFFFFFVYIVPFDPLELKPQVIFPRTGTEKETKQYDDRCVYYTTTSSWQTTDTWYQWIKFIAGVIAEGLEGPHVILIDSYRVHFAHPTLVQQLSDELDVHLYPLVTNATQFCQPMDQYIIPQWKHKIKSLVDIYILS